MIYQLSLTFQKDREIYIYPQRKKGCMWLFILKRVAEEIFNIAQLLMHYLSQFQLNLHLFTATHIKKEKIWAGQVGQVPPLNPP